MAHSRGTTTVTVTHLTLVTGLVQAPGPCGSAPPPDESRASSERMSRRMCTTHTSRHADTSSGGLLMGGLRRHVRLCAWGHAPGVFRPDGSPPGTIHSLIHTVDKSVYKGSVHSRINVSETAPRRPSQSLEPSQRSRASPAPLRRTRACTRPHKTGYRTVCQTCARSVRHPVSRLMPHGGTPVPSKLVTVSCLSSV